jgi:hypothetical protein
VLERCHCGGLKNVATGFLVVLSALCLLPAPFFLIPSPITWPLSPPLPNDFHQLLCVLTAVVEVNCR